MRLIHTSFEGLLILEPEVHNDDRGYFYESFNKRLFSQFNIPYEYVQENFSRSKKNVIRGLHFQRPPMAQAKLVWVVQGLVRDVVLDLRRDQPTFGKTFVLELSSENLKRLFVPVGFAHGFSVISESADVCYICDKFFSPNHQSGVNLRDPELNIDWGVHELESIVSQRDAELPWLTEIKPTF